MSKKTHFVTTPVVLLSSKVLSTLLSDDPGQTKTGYRKIAFIAYVATACLLFSRRFYVAGSASRM